MPLEWTKYWVTKQKSTDRQTFPRRWIKKGDKFTTNGDIDKKNAPSLAEDILSTFRFLLSLLTAEMNDQIPYSVKSLVSKLFDC